jgi:peptidoglycan/LPS O-acetylase OafA/YrhL
VSTTAPAATSQADRFPLVDGLRALAALAIVARGRPNPPGTRPS